MAASVAVSGVSDEWLDLVKAIEKVLGIPLRGRKSADWLRGFCEGSMIAKERADMGKVVVKVPGVVDTEGRDYEIEISPDEFGVVLTLPDGQ